MPEIKLKTVEGKEVIYVDLRGIKTTKPDQQAKFESLIDEVLAILRTYTADVRLLYDVGGGYANRDTLKKLKEITELIKQRKLVARKAIVGLEGIQNVLLTSANLVFGSSVKPFKSEKEAYAYLLADQP